MMDDQGSRPGLHDSAALIFHGVAVEGDVLGSVPASTMSRLGVLTFSLLSYIKRGLGATSSGDLVQVWRGSEILKASPEQMSQFGWRRKMFFLHVVFHRKVCSCLNVH